jgi:hypothetical protein
MKQTAVDYIKEKLMCNEYWYENMTFDQIFEQAKGMEKEQIIDSYRDGRSDQQSDRPSKFYNRMAEQYYNETYESNTRI